MSATVKTRIIAEIKAAISGIADISTVIGIDAAALEQGSRSTEWEQAIKTIVGGQAADGKTFAVEMDASPDEAAELETAGSRQMMLIDTWDFEVLFLIHLPEAIPPDDDDQPQTPMQVAEMITARMYAIMGRLTPATAGAQCGQWLALTGGGDGQPLAQFTSVAARGGVALSDIGTRVTFLRAIVRYRTAKGDATAAA